MEKDSWEVSFQPKLEQNDATDTKKEHVLEVLEREGPVIF